MKGTRKLGAPQPWGELAVEDVAVNIGGVSALRGVSLKVARDEIVGLIGPNGAGKTTLFNAITGVVRAQRGRVFFEGVDITGLPIERIAERGLSRTFQLTALFDEMTVHAAIAMGAHLRAPATLRNSFFPDRTARDTAEKLATDLVAKVGLEALADEFCANLSHGHRKLASVAIALAAGPRCLLLDEPLAGLNDREVARTVALIHSVRRDGCSVLIVEHNVHEVLGLCDRVVVVDFGKDIAEGVPAVVQDDPRVREAYLGADIVD